MKIECRQVVRSFATARALEGLDLVVEGQCVALIGPSGGGKSTFLRVLAGLLPVDSGTVEVNELPHPHLEKELSVYRRSVGTVFQSYNLFSHMSVLQNILLPLREVHKWTKDRSRERAFELLEHFELAPHAGKRPNELSGGQRQRAAIIRAIAPGPKILFLDEPTSALDPEMTAGVLSMLAELKESGTDMVLVTHQMGFAREVADQSVFLAAGRVVESGPDLFQAAKAPSVQTFLEKVLRY